MLEFGIKRENEERRDGGCAVVFDPVSQKYAVGKHTEDGLLRLFSGGVDDSENIKKGVLRELKEESGLYNFLYVEKIGKVLCHFYAILKNLNRIAYTTCFLVILKDTLTKKTNLEKHEKFTLFWATQEEILKNWQFRNKNRDYDHWVYFLKKAIKRAKELGYDNTSAMPD